MRYPPSSIMALIALALRRSVSGGGGGGGGGFGFVAARSLSSSSSSAFAPAPSRAFGTKATDGGGGGALRSNVHRTWDASDPTVLSQRRRRKPSSSDSLNRLSNALRKTGRLGGGRFEGGAFLGATVESGGGSESSVSVASEIAIGISNEERDRDAKDRDDDDEEEDDDDYDLPDDGILFPLLGKRAEECPPRMRFAPSPTGSLHVGGARTALYNWLVAKRGQLDFPGTNGGFVIRVEDTDLARSTKESEESVLADLRWLGLDWDEGPDMDLAGDGDGDGSPSSSDSDSTSTRRDFGPYRQSERTSLYSKIANRLIDSGQAYPCFSTKEELEETKARQEADGEPARYDGAWRDADPDLVSQKMKEGLPFTVRFKVPPGARVVIDDAVRGTVSWDAESTVGDFILLRSTGVPVYNFCVAVDDASMGITTVIRAEEHLTNTLRQGLVLDALGIPRPRYAHCSLILGEDKQKLSKRHGATSCDQFRVDGFLPDAMINYLALLGWNDGSDEEIFTRDELVEAFDVNRVVKSPSIFDMDKLKWVNSQHLKMRTVEEVTDLVREQMTMTGMLDEDIDMDVSNDFVFASTALAKQMMETTRDAADNAREVLGYDLPPSFRDLPDGSEAKVMIAGGNFYPVARAVLRDFEGGTLPTPDPTDPLAPFLEGGGNKPAAAGGPLIEEDNLIGGSAYSYPKAYKAHMKNLSKELNLKGKNLFHPLRLALTGSMSGQDVTKQLALLALTQTAQDGGGKNSASPVKNEEVGVVPIEVRMERLKEFCETVPEEFRSPAAKQGKKGVEAKGSNGGENAKGDAQNGGDASSSNAATTTTAADIADPLDSYDGPPITALDIRVGRIGRVWEHEEADKLYCEEVDVGEKDSDEDGGKPRTRLIASGLKEYMKPSDMEGRLVLVLCNLKARKMMGFPSHGMVLCASSADHTRVKFVSPPVDAVVGERVTVPGFEFEGEGGKPYAENKFGKKKVFEKIAPHLVTDEYGTPRFLGRPFLTSAGVCTSPIAGANVA